VSAVKLRGKRTEALRTHLNSPTNFAEDPEGYWDGDHGRVAHDHRSDHAHGRDYGHDHDHE
jgi:hypothetical protein